LRRATIQATTAFILIFAAHAHAQTRPSDADARRADAQAARPGSPNADEEFELNIDRRRINEGDFHAETAVSTDGARGLQLNVGVALRASEIDVLLRNVRGRVRFRATLDPVLRLLDSRRNATRQSQPSPAPP
jgi:hypothetical protein